MDSGFHAVDSGFHVCGSRIPHPWILDYNYGWIPDPISWIPDSKAVDSGFHPDSTDQNDLDSGFRIPDSGLPYMGRKTYILLLLTALKFIVNLRIWPIFLLNVLHLFELNAMYFSVSIV